MSSYSFQSGRNDLNTTRFADIPEPEEVQLADNEALLRVDAFALTANNITYGVAGDSALGYWKFFPADEGWGHVPVWGMSTVLRSNHPGLTEGQRYFGYYPMASYLKVQPEKVSDRGFVDGAEHRQGQAPVYNQYALVSEANGFTEGHDDHQMIYKGLFATSFVIDDFLDDNDNFGATQVVISSASSKTSFGLAYLLHSNRNLNVVGLTSASNKAFVESMGIYHEVLSYEDVENLDPGVKTAFVDMAGNRQVLERIHNHFNDNLVCSSGVGITHWEARDGADPASLPGAKPTMFFAPAQMQKRNGDWGPEVYQQKLNDAWTAFLGRVDEWVHINHPEGRQGLEETYRTVLSGADPDQSYVVKP